MVGGDLIDSGLAIPPGVLCLVMPTHGAADDDVEAMVQQEIAHRRRLMARSATPSSPWRPVTRTASTLQVRGSGAPVRLRLYLFEVGADASCSSSEHRARPFDGASPSFDAIVKSLRFGV